MGKVKSTFVKCTLFSQCSEMTKNFLETQKFFKKQNFKQQNIKFVYHFVRIQFYS